MAKAATTSLFRYLAQHPDVCPADLKELRYFSALRYGEPLPPLETYSRHFSHHSGERYRMEATPGYYAGGRTVAEAVDRLLPDARAIVSFRDPVQRCWSWYRFVRSTARIPKEMTFPEYVDRCVHLHREGTDGRRENQPFWGLGGGCYDTWLEPWLEVLGERLRVEYFEYVVSAPRDVVEDLCDWLGIDRTVCAGFSYAIENKTVQYKNKRLQMGALFVNRRSERFFAQHPGLKRSLRSAYYRVNGDAAEVRMDAPTRERLTDFYAPHNQRLVTMLDAAGIAGRPDWLGTHRAA
ncbi:sulfotransferase family protein [Geodermatophilus telluris]|uniref:sulfotransferase family protein n=1 Tax=Geodermatophilus telluris TaxID=1190417 RepID=UPI000B85A331|nr:sulfotransferase [Geodermatophilus telluris]